MGDFNLDLLKYENHQDTNNFINTMSSFFFHPQILQPTRITDHSATLIDNIFFNSIEYIKFSGNLVYDLTDHLPNFLIIKKIHPKKSKFEVHVRDYSKLNERRFIDEIDQTDWDQALSHTTNIDDMFDTFHTRIEEIVNKHGPVRKLSKKEIKLKDKPWITKAIQISIRKKNSIYKKYIKTKLHKYFLKFKYYRNKLNHLIKISKKQYYNNYFSAINNDNKKLWSGIKQIMGNNNRNKMAPSKLINDDQEIIDKRSIANAFNSFFFKYWYEIGRGDTKCKNVSV